MVSTVGAMSFTQAASDNNQVEVRLNYVPSAYVPMGEVYVEFDSRFIENNMVFGEDDVINFAFFYDVAYLTWGGAVTVGDGYQCDNWFYDVADPNATCQYTEHRFGGVFNVMIDGYDIGVSNFDISADNGNYQDIAINLEIGWHYLTIVAAELVSDCNRTEGFHWEYAKDQKVFYVSHDKEDELPVLGEANYNTITVTADPVISDDLNLGYNISSFADNPRPKAEATLNQYTVVDEGNLTNPETIELAVQFNASDADLALNEGPFGGANLADVYAMGPYTYAWIMNDGAIIDGNNTFTPTQLTGEDVSGEGYIQYARLGQNYIYFVLTGMKVDDFGSYIGAIYGVPINAPQLAMSVVRFSLWIGEEVEIEEIDPCADCPCPEPTPGFGIFISVSILGLAAVIVLLRKRK